MLNLNINEIVNPADLKSLEIRRLVFDVIFVYKLLNENIDCSELLRKIGLNVPSFISKNNPFLLYLSPVITIPLVGVPPTKCVLSS